MQMVKTLVCTGPSTEDTQKKSEEHLEKKQPPDLNAASSQTTE